VTYSHIETFTFTKETYLPKVPDLFLVEGMLHRSMTLIHGQTTAGKSMLAMSLGVAVASGAENWNGKVLNGSGPVTYVGGDPGVIYEAYDRLDRVRGDIGAGEVRIIAPERPTRREAWLEIADRSQGSQLLILDNLTQFVPGSLNDDSAVRAVMEELTALTRNDMAVCVLAHSSDKRNEHGYAPDKPAGSFSIRSIPRWFISLDRKEGSHVVAKLAGNDARPWEMTLTEPSDRPRFDVLDVTTPDQVAARKRRRAKATLDLNAQAWQLLDGGMTGKDVAAKLGKSESWVSRVKNLDRPQAA
jgi:hypothetical protein